MQKSRRFSLVFVSSHELHKPGILQKPNVSLFTPSSLTYFFLIKLSNSGARCLALFLGYLFWPFS